eukprot:14257015-Heterocapsa_arctica.AAC.1
MQQRRLTRFQLALSITSGRNECRSGIAAAPAEIGQILRLLREGAAPQHAHQQPAEPPVEMAQEVMEHRIAAKARPRVAKRKL